MFLIGLTGGIGTGKTTISNYIRSIGIPVIDSDKIARQVVEPNSKCWKLIRKHFGDEAILKENNEINRPFLAQIIFSNPEKRKLLNSITHPEIQKRTFFQLLYYYLTFRLFVVLDIPLLFESSVYKPYMSYVIVVRCEADQQLERIKLRNGYNDEEAQNRITSQMPVEEKCRLADFVLDNSGNVDQTLAQAKTYFQNVKLPYTFWVFRCLLIGFYVGGFTIVTKLLNTIL